MTSPATGITTKNPVPVASYTLPSSATTLQNNQNLQDGKTPTKIVVPPSTVVTGLTTTMPDLPGMVSFPFRAFFTSPRDVRSAAANTALAFGLDQKKSADLAVRYQKLLVDSTITKAPPVSDDSIIIPP